VTIQRECESREGLVNIFPMTERILLEKRRKTLMAFGMRTWKPGFESSLVVFDSKKLDMS
jgi:hypothetical protein